LVMAMVRPDPQDLAAWRALVGAFTTLRERLDRDLVAERGLPLAWYDVMYLLYGAPGRRLRMQELARGAFFSKSGLSQLVSRMEAAGLVVREECPSDRRGTFAVLTPHGRRTYLHATAVHFRGIREHFGEHLSSDEAHTLRCLLERISDWPPS
jgi:DNA-binding MarR family transcriptional regulator